MTKIQNSIDCPYCSIQLKAAKTDKGFYYVCPKCEPVKMITGEKRLRSNENGGYKRNSDQIDEIKTKIYFYV